MKNAALFAAASVAGSIAAGSAAVGQSAPNAPAIDIGTAQVGSGGDNAPTVPQTAAQYAPSAPNLNQVEPTSTLKSETLSKIIVPTENYNDIIRLTPSTQDISPVGPGLQQDFGESIRGLQYTQFSVLFDGIPIPGFPINFAPQPGIYFTSNDISAVTVHRGPGQASVTAPNTFGGFVDLNSAAFDNNMSVMPYGTAGSYGTELYGVQAQTGTIAQLNGARAMLDVENEDAGGATSDTSTRRRNEFFKYEQPIGDNTVVTVLANVDHTYTRTPYGATLANMQAFGPNYALNNDPQSQSYGGYNHDDYTTDFEYIGVKSDLGNGLTVDDHLYTTSYYQRSSHGLDVGGLGPNLSGISYINGQTPMDLTGDVPGMYSKIYFRNTGNILRFTQDTDWGQARFGLWAEHELYTFSSFEDDLTRGYTPITAAPGSIYINNYRSNLNTFQPYGEFAWKPLPTVTVTAGLKYSLVERTLKGEAGLNGQPQDLSQTYGAPLPSLDVNWRVTPWASVFAQAARGFETPNLNLFSATQLTAVNPSTTNSFQIGNVIDRPGFTLGTDLYYIQYQNYIDSRTVGDITTFYNQGGAVYKGIEVEGTVKLPQHFAIYANGSLNSSSYDSNGNAVAQTPRWTSAVGLIYDRGSFFHEGDDLFASMITKFVGPQYGLDTATVGQSDSIPIKTYSQIDLSAGYTFTYDKQRLTFKVNAYNLADNRSIIGYAGATIGPPSQPLYFTQAGRSLFFSLSAKI